MKHYLAIDLGAESGRMMLGTLNNGQVSIREIHRFPNLPLEVDGSIHWNTEKLWSNVLAGCKKASDKGLQVSSVSTDSWGVDYLMFDEAERVISPTFHYRDPRTKRGVRQTYERVSWNTIFAETGIQFMPLNTIFQLAAEGPERLEKADMILGVGDAVNFMLSGVAHWEVSLASTTQLYNPITRQWSELLMEKLGLDPSLFPSIVPSGTILGELKTELATEVGLAGVKVTASCSHDTGAAVAAVPAQTGTSNWAYLSSGTWSLMGVEHPRPILTDQCRNLNFTNEIGFGNSIRLLKNIIGLWLVQECRREWEKHGHSYDYATLTQLAAKAEPFVSLIDPSDPRFVHPGDMTDRIAAYCRETGQPEPQSPGAFIRCSLESLALLYRETIDQLEELTGNPVERLHIVGGGSRNQLLNQLTANALQRQVRAGPHEATAMGNILVQAIAADDISSLSAARDVVTHSVNVEEFEPEKARAWREARLRFADLRGR